MSTAKTSFDREQLLTKMRTLRIWRRRGQLAPHKPLLLLYALANLREGRSVLKYEDVDRDLATLFEKFGFAHGSVHTEYPFWRLQNDGIWEVSLDQPIAIDKDNSDPKKSELKRANAKGQFSEEVREVLRQDANALYDVARVLLERNFPKSLHRDIVAAIGLPARDIVD